MTYTPRRPHELRSDGYPEALAAAQAPSRSRATCIRTRRRLSAKCRTASTEGAERVPASPTTARRRIPSRAQIEAVAGEISAGISRDDLQTLLPPGGARNAVDCALWDLEAKQSGKTVWQMIGWNPKPVTTVYTVGIDTPEAMQADAAAHSEYPFIKVKVGIGDPLAQIGAINAGAPTRDRHRCKPGLVGDRPRAICRTAEGDGRRDDRAADASRGRRGLARLQRAATALRRRVLRHQR